MLDKIKAIKKEPLLILTVFTTFVQYKLAKKQKHDIQICSHYGIRYVIFFIESDIHLSLSQNSYQNHKNWNYGKHRWGLEKFYWQFYALLLFISLSTHIK